MIERCGDRQHKLLETETQFGLSLLQRKDSYNDQGVTKEKRKRATARTNEHKEQTDRAKSHKCCFPTNGTCATWRLASLSMGQHALVAEASHRRCRKAEGGRATSSIGPKPLLVD